MSRHRRPRVPRHPHARPALRHRGGGRWFHRRDGVCRGRGGRVGAEASGQFGDRRRRTDGLPLRTEQGYDYAVQVDADGQHCPEEIEKLRATMAADPSLDLVSGSRFLSDEHGYRAPVSRRTGIHLFAFLLSLIVRQRVSDPTSALRLYNRRPMPSWHATIRRWRRSCSCTITVSV